MPRRKRNEAMRAAGSSESRESKFWDHLINKQMFRVQYASDVPGSGSFPSLLLLLIQLLMISLLPLILPLLLMIIIIPLLLLILHY